jgi:hypothetical protein
MTDLFSVTTLVPVQKVTIKSAEVIFLVALKIENTDEKVSPGYAIYGTCTSSV